MQREVLISPYSVKHPLAASHHIAVNLKRAKVEDSPNVDTHQPVSRQHEMQIQTYYGFPDCWDGVGVWGMNAYPLVLPGLPTDPCTIGGTGARSRCPPARQRHLCAATKGACMRLTAAPEIGIIDIKCGTW